MSHPFKEAFKILASITSCIPFVEAPSRFGLRRQYRRPAVARMPIPGDRFASIRSDDQFLVSYPRSGNTWVRNLIRNVFILKNPQLPEPIIWELLPDIHVPEHPLDHPVVQQFQLPSRILKSHNIRDLRPGRLVYIVRHPADALVSYYHYHRLQKQSPDLTQNGIDTFCCNMVGGWVEHVERALHIYRQQPADTLLVSYESLHSDTTAELRRITEFLGTPVSGDLLSAAVEKSSFARLRSLEESRRGMSDEYFFRKGRSGSAKEELSEKTLQFLGRKAIGTYERVISVIRSDQPCTAAVG